MFLRHSRRKKDGKEHRYWSVVENRRAGRRVVQRRVLYLGEINDSQRESWRQAGSVFDEDTREDRQMALYPADRELPVHAEGSGVRVQLDRMRLRHPRRWGDCTTGGFPLAYEVLPGNTIDNQTLRDFLARIQRQYGKAKRLWLMDRGIPTEDVLAEMRASDPPAQYLVGTPKGRLSRLEGDLVKLPKRQAHAGVDVKLLAEGGETYALARSRDRVGKERGMRRRRLRQYLATLRRLRLERKRPPTRDQLLRALGAAASQAGRDASVVDLTLPAEGHAVTPETFAYRINRARWRELRKREGCYLLRTNMDGADPAELWERYMQLVQVEEAFRNLKGDLGLRPIWHQREERIEAHVFISFLSYCLHVTLRARLKALAPGLTPRAVFE